MVSSIDVLREEIGGAKQAYDTDAYRSEIPGICYGMAVRALHEDTITPEDFAALVGDGTVSRFLRSEECHTPTETFIGVAINMMTLEMYCLTITPITPSW